MKKSRERPWSVDGSQVKGLCVFEFGWQIWQEMAAAYVSCHTMQVRKRSDKQASEQMWLQLKHLEKKNQPPHLHNWEFIMLLKSKVMLCYFNFRVIFAWVLLSCQLMCGTSFSPWSYTALCCVQGVTANHRRHLSSFLNPTMVLLVKQNGVITDGCNCFSVLSTSDQHHWRRWGLGWEWAWAPLRL